MKRFGKIILSLVMAFSMLNARTPVHGETETILPFTDISMDKWYGEYVAKAYELELMTGTTSTTFEPYSNMTRGQVATVLYRMAGKPEVEFTGKFKDVVKGKYYTNAVEWASSVGIITGYTQDSTFRPGNNITRQDFALMMYRYVKNYLGLDVTVDEGVALDGFADANEVSNYAKEAIIWAYANGIIGGKTKGNVKYIAPKETATRAECCKMLVVTNDLIEELSKLPEENAYAGVIELAESYLELTPFSRKGMIEQLVMDGYDEYTAVYVADHLNADWNEQAGKQAKQYLELAPFSKSGLIEQLEFDGYTTEEAEYGVNSIDTNWNEQARKEALIDLELMPFSQSGLIEQLEFDGYTEEEAEYGVTSNNIDWNEQAVLCGKSYLEDEYSTFTRDELYDQLVFEGFTEEQVEFALGKLF